MNPVVPGVLRPWVADIDVRTPGDRPLTHLPDPATALVWRVTADGRSGAFIAGPRTQAAYYAKDLPLAVRVRLRPGCMARLLGVAPGELVDRVVPLGPSWDLASDDPELAVRRITAALIARLPGTPPPGLIRLAAAGLAARTPVRATAQRLGVSERKLRDAFTSAVGLSPRHFARLTRIRAVLAGAGRVPLAELAAGVGYYDQAHMTADFRRVMHVTPGAFAAGRLPTPRAC